MWRPRSFLLAGLILILASLQPAWGQAPVPVIFWHGMGGHLGTVVQALVTQFNESQSAYRVEAIYKGSYDEVVTAAIAAYRAQDPPHLVQVYEVGTQTMLMSGAIYPVYQLMSDHGYQVDWESFVAPVLSYYSKDGNLYSMPFNSSTPILYYNKDAFAQAGLDPEQPPATWDEVEAFSRQIMERDAASCGFTIQWPSWTMIENMRAWHGLPIATQENGFAGLDVELLINDEFGRMHVGKLAEWAKSGIFQYGGRGGSSDPLFLNGQCAIFIASSAAMGTIRQAASFNWATAMLPHWGEPYEKVNSIIGGASLWVLMGARNPDAYAGVAAFLHFLTQPEQQAFWHKETGYIAISNPANELLEREGHFEANPDQRTAWAQMTYSPPTPHTRGLRLGNFIQIRDVIEEELENIFAGTKTAEQGLDDAVARANRLLRDFADLYR